MKNKLKLLLITCLVISIQVLGQTQPCDTVYKTVDHNPTFEGGMSQLMEYSGKFLTPIISKHYKKDIELPSKLGIMLTIDTNGKIVDAVLSNHKLSKECEDEIIKQLLTMTGWNPGLLKGEKVCCKFAWFISCIKWG